MSLRDSWNKFVSDIQSEREANKNKVQTWDVDPTGNDQNSLIVPKEEKTYDSGNISIKSDPVVQKAYEGDTTAAKQNNQVTTKATTPIIQQPQKTTTAKAAQEEYTSSGTSVTDKYRTFMDRRNEVSDNAEGSNSLGSSFDGIKGINTNNLKEEPDSTTKNTIQAYNLKMQAQWDVEPEVVSNAQSKQENTNNTWDIQPVTYDNKVEADANATKTISTGSTTYNPNYGYKTIYDKNTGKWYNIPTIYKDRNGDAVMLSDKDAIQEYYNQGVGLGEFYSYEEANKSLQAQIKGIEEETKPVENAVSYTRDNITALTKKAKELSEKTSWTEEERALVGQILDEIGVQATEIFTDPKDWWQKFVGNQKTNVGALVDGGLDYETASKVFYNLSNKYNAKGSAFTMGMMEGSGILPLTTSIVTGFAKVLGKEEALKDFAQGFDEITKLEEFTSSSAPIASMMGNLAGSSIFFAMANQGLGASKVLTKLGKISPILKGMATNALTLGGMSAINNSDDLILGKISGEEYAKQTAINSGIGAVTGGLNGLTGIAVGKFMDKYNLPYNRLTATIISSLSSGTSYTTMQELYKAFDKNAEKTSAEDVIEEMLIGMALGAIMGFVSYQDPGKNVGFKSRTDSNGKKISYKWFTGNETEAELKAKYRKLAMQYHPDRGGDEAIIKEINSEYDALSRLFDANNMASAYTKATEAKANGDATTYATEMNNFTKAYEDFASTMQTSPIYQSPEVNGVSITDATDLLSSIVNAMSNIKFAPTQTPASTPTANSTTNPIGVKIKDSTSYLASSLPSTNYAITNAPQGEIDAQNTIIRANASTGDIDYITVDDFNGNPDPIITNITTLTRDANGNMVVVDNTPTETTVLTNKAAYVPDDYEGFNVAEAKAREEEIKSAPKTYGVSYNTQKMDNKAYRDSKLAEIEKAKTPSEPIAVEPTSVEQIVETAPTVEVAETAPTVAEPIAQQPTFVANEQIEMPIAEMQTMSDNIVNEPETIKEIQNVTEGTDNLNNNQRNDSIAYTNGDSTGTEIEIAIERGTVSNIGEVQKNEQQVSKGFKRVDASTLHNDLKSSEIDIADDDYVANDAQLKEIKDTNSAGGVKTLFYNGKLVGNNEVYGDSYTSSDGKLIMVQLDHPIYSPSQFNGHEYAHVLDIKHPTKYDSNTGAVVKEGYASRMYDAISEEFGRDEVNDAFVRYKLALELAGINISNERAKMEFIGNIRGGMNVIEEFAKYKAYEGYDDVARFLNVGLNESDLTDTLLNAEIEYLNGIESTQTVGEPTILYSTDNGIVIDENGAFINNDIAKTISEDGPLFSYGLWNTPAPKESISVNPKTSTSKLEKTERSGKEVLESTMADNGFSKEEIDNAVATIDHFADLIKKAELKYKYAGLKDINDAKIIISNVTGQVALSAMVPDGRYPINFDLTQECIKRHPLNRVITELAKQKGRKDKYSLLEEVSLSAENLWKINEILANEGYDTACLTCFVETRRYNLKEWAESFINSYNELVDKYNPNAEYFNFNEDDININKLSDSDVDELTRDLNKAVEDYKDYKKTQKDSNVDVAKETVLEVMERNIKASKQLQKKLRISDLITPNGRTNLKKSFRPTIESWILRWWGSNTPKAVETFTPYNNQIALMSDTVGKDKQPLSDYMREIAGVRTQSFSDFQITHFLDDAQKTADLQARKLPAHRYSKVPECPIINGLTNEKINMSILFNVDISNTDPAHAGLIKTGKNKYDYYYADAEHAKKWKKQGRDQIYDQSYPIKLAQEIMNTPGYSSNCGTIGVGLSWYHNIRMDEDSNMRFIIPRHKSGMPVFISEVTHLGTTADYTDVQNTLQFVSKTNQFKEVVNDFYGVPSYATWSIGAKKTKNSDITYSLKDELAKARKNFKGKYTEDNVDNLPGMVAMKNFNKFMEDNRLTPIVKKGSYKGNEQIAHGSYDVYADVEKTQSPRVTANNYIEWCIDNDMIPLFYEFADRHNYYKYLFDFNMYDCITEEYAPQLPVQLKYPENIDEVFNKYMRIYNNKMRVLEEALPDIVNKVYDATKVEDAPIYQAHTSAGTSGNLTKVPVLYTNKNAVFVKDGVNIDIGAGKTEMATNYLKDNYGVTNMPFDPFNRPKSVNEKVTEFLQSGNKADTATCSNCLNVIDNADARANVILEMAKAIKPNGKAYFSVYSDEKNLEQGKAGEVKSKPDQWQEFRLPETYVDEISKYFDNVEVKGGKYGIIVASEPKANLPKATWQTSSKVGAVGEKEDSVVQFSYDLTANDEEYMNYLKENKEKKAKEIIDKRAKEQGYTVEGFHGTGNSFRVFDVETSSESNNFGRGIYMSTSKEEAERYWKDDTLGDTYNQIDIAAYDKAEERMDREEIPDNSNYDNFFTELYNEEYDKELARRVKEGRVINLYAKIEKPFIVSPTQTISVEEAKELASLTWDQFGSGNDWKHGIDSWKVWGEGYNGQLTTDVFANKLGHGGDLTEVLQKSHRYDGIIDYTVGKKFDSPAEAHIIVFNANQVKDASVITYDKDGNIIPPSKRFEPNRSDINFSYDLTKKVAPVNKVDTTLKDEIAELRKENETLTKQLAKAQKEMKLTPKGEETYTFSSAKKVVESIAEDYNSRVDVNKLTEKFIKLANETLRNKDLDVNDYYEIYDMALDIARPVVNQSRILKSNDETIFENLYEDIVKASDVYLTQEEQKLFEDYDKFKKINRGYINFNEDPSKGMTVDDFYSELMAKYDTEFFPDPAKNQMDVRDKLERIVEVLKASRPIYANPYDSDKAEAISAVAKDVLTRSISEGMNVQMTKADKWNLKVEDAKAEGRANLEKLRAEKNARIEEIKAKAKADANERLAKLKDKKNKQILALRDHYKQVQYNKKLRQQESQLNSKLLDMMNKLKGIKTTSANKQMIDAIIAPFDTVASKITGSTIERINDILEFQAKWEQTHPGFKFFMPPAYNKLLERDGKTTIKELSVADRIALLETLRAIKKQIDNDKRFLKSKVAEDSFNAAMAIVQDIESSSGKGPQHINYFVGNTLSPDRVINMVTGYVKSDPFRTLWYELAVEGNDKVYAYQREANALFDKFSNDKQFVKDTRGKHSKTMTIKAFDGKGNEVEVEVTVGTAMSLAMHGINDDNIRHAQSGGINIPNLHRLLKGDKVNAVSAGQIYVFSKQQLNNIYNELTKNPQYKEFLGQVKYYFNDFSPIRINEVSEEKEGFPIATIKNYFPIHIDKNHLEMKDVTNYVGLGGLPGMSWKEDRTSSSTKPMVVTDIWDEIEKMIQQHSMYVGLEIPARNFRKVWAYSSETHAEDNPSIRELLAVRDTVDKKWGGNIVEIINRAYSDALSYGYNSDVLAKYLDKFRSSYAGSVLMLNAGVAVTQSASYFTAAPIIGWTPLIRALLLGGDTADVETMKKYSPFQYYREKGYSSVEVGDVTSKGKQIPTWLNWIQGVDIATTRTLWRASEFYVREKFPNLKVGTDEYNKKVGEVHTEVLTQTQPNYTSAQRPGFLREKDSGARALFMFKTQLFQQFGLLFDAMGEANAEANRYKNATDENEKAQAKEAMNKATKKSADAWLSVVLSSAMVALIRFGRAYLRGKDDQYRDKDGNMTKKSTAIGLAREFFSSIFGMAPFLTDIYSLVSAIIFKEKYYGFENNTFYAVSDIFSDIYTISNKTISLANNIANNNDDDPDNDEIINWENYGRVLLDSASTIGKFLGIPTDNISKIFKVVFKNAMKQTQGDILGEYYYLRLIEQPTENKNDFIDLLNRAKNEEPEIYDKLYKLITNDFIGSDITDEKIKDRLENLWKTEEGVKSVDKLSERYLSPSQQTIYDKAEKQIKNCRYYNELKTYTTTDNDVEKTVDNKEKVKNLLYLYATESDASEIKSIRNKSTKTNVPVLDLIEFQCYIDEYDEPSDSGKYGTKTNVEIAKSLSDFSKDKNLNIEQIKAMWFAYAASPTEKNFTTNYNLYIK